MRWIVLLLILLVNAFCFVLIKVGLVYASPLLFASLRLLLAGAALFLLLRFWHKPLVPPRRTWAVVLLLALFASAITYGAMFISPGLAGAGIAVVLGNLQPLLVVLLALPLLGERLTRGKGVALLLGLSGIILLAYPSLQNRASLTGSLLALLAALGAAFGSVLVKRLKPGEYLVTVTAGQLFLGGLLLGGAALWLEPLYLRFTPIFLGILVSLALLGTAFVTAAWYWLLQAEEVGRLSQ